jgi:pyridoxal phosphate enzyme (YggS family)|tara:strand:+ start:356 stop:1018 length:663 start_codon:yes stop_codon:yes gene_type:complete
MHKSVDNLILIENEIKQFLQKDIIKNSPNIIAISKTFPMTDILPLINYGHKHFGENKVQEALQKWESIKADFEEIKLHFVGNLQSNKVKLAIQLFDYIHSLDSLRLAEKISKEQAKQKKKIKIFIQVNIGNEIQKNGIEISQLENFYKRCIEEFDLNIIGLMCLPPKNKSSSDYFLEMEKLKKNINLQELSMGMSNDYLEAIKNNSSYVRIGTKIFGERD